MSEEKKVLDLRGLVSVSHLKGEQVEDVALLVSEKIQEVTDDYWARDDFVSVTNETVWVKFYDAMKALRRWAKANGVEILEDEDG